MLPAILAAAAALPTAVKIVQDIRDANKKAETASQVATDPNAPPAVKQAAVNVAGQAIEKKAALEKQVLVDATGADDPSAAGVSTSTVVLLAIAAVLLLKKR